MFQNVSKKRASGIRGFASRLIELGLEVRLCFLIDRLAQVSLLSGVLLLPDLAAAQVQTGSFFNNQGPAPRFGPAALLS